MFKRSLLAIFGLAALLCAQVPGSKVEFEVASIRPADPPTPEALRAGKFRIGMQVDGARADFGFLSLRELIPMAYRLKAFQLSGPDWLNAQRFDISAKLPEGATSEQVPEMLQALLAERFKLTSHRDTQERSVYALVVAKGGHKLKEAVAQETAEANPPSGARSVAEVNGQRITLATNGGGATISGGPNGPMRMSMAGGVMRMDLAKVTMSRFAEMLTGFVDRPVVDMTELKGEYQAALEISMEEMISRARVAGAIGNPGIAAGGGVPAAGPAGLAAPGFAPGLSSDAIFKAVQDLGLKLESRKAPIEILIVDHVEKNPTDN